MWEGPPKNQYGRMVYENGEPCWQGGSRSTTVSTVHALEVPGAYEREISIISVLSEIPQKLFLSKKSPQFSHRLPRPVPQHLNQSVSKRCSLVMAYSAARTKICLAPSCS